MTTKGTHGVPGRDDISVLHSDQAQLRAILATVVDAIVTIDTSGIIESINPAGERLFGYSATDLIGQNVSVLMAEPDRSRHNDYIRRYLDTGQRHVLGVGREILARRKDGSMFPADLAVSEMFVAGRRMFTGLIHDISKRKKFEAELIAAREMAEKASRAKSEFLSSMSHELRTPLHSILGFAQLLHTDEPPLTPSQRESVDFIVKAGETLLDLISDLLDLSRIDAGKIPVSIEPVPLDEVIESTTKAITPLLGDNHIAINVNVDNVRRCGILADYVRTKQVLLNLLSNAVKYNRPGGSITIDCELRDGYTVRVAVRDTGIGIPRERHGDVFTPFDRLGNENGAVHGNGIGLVITKRLTELMGGRIGFESESGVGSTFWVEFPRAHLRATDESIVEIDGAQPATGHDGPRAHVLYIEDNPSNVRLMERLIATRPNTQLTVAPEPALGLELARGHRPDLILLDINLPDMDGFEVLAQLRADATTKHIPVIAVTANAMPRDVERGAAAGFDGYVTKPINIAEFFKLYDATLASLPR